VEFSEDSSMADEERFGARLRELRQAAGLTQEQLAIKAGVKVGTLRDIEQSRNSPRWKTVLALSEALGVSCEAFRPAAAAEG
jgi:transcriptional regulator with XRE-family HTH domain